MRIHTNLTLNQLYSALPQGVYSYVTPKGSRKRERAFEVKLYVFEKDELHRRYGNSGGYGRSEDVAATWDEWGVWIDRLFKLDPRAIIGHYTSPEDFRFKTQREQSYVAFAHKEESLAVRTHTAPWLEDVA